MFRRLQPRFSLRAALIFVALCACALVFTRQWAKVRNASEDYSRACALWEGGRILLGEVVDAATRLYESESTTLWIGKSKAAGRQIERLTYLADKAEALVRTTMFSAQGARDRMMQCEHIRARIADLRGSPEKD